VSASKLKRRPPGPGTAEEFIAAAGVPATAKHLPWDAPGVREDVTRVYNLRLPEPYLLKLKYIAEHSPRSMQRVCLDALLPAIDAEIEHLTGRRPDKGS
jgi:hypothetical protein